MTVISEKQMLEAILSTIETMEEGFEYQFAKNFIDAENICRKKYGYSLIKQDQFQFTVLRGMLYCNKQRIIELSEIRNLQHFAFAVQIALPTSTSPSSPSPSVKSNK